LGRSQLMDGLWHDENPINPILGAYPMPSLLSSPGTSPLYSCNGILSYNLINGYLRKYNHW
jgi:hypothetical protein